MDADSSALGHDHKLLNATLLEAAIYNHNVMYGCMIELCHTAVISLAR